MVTFSQNLTLAVLDDNPDNENFPDRILFLAKSN